MRHATTPPAGALPGRDRSLARRFRRPL